MLSNLHTEVVHKLTEWQVGYLERGDADSAAKIEDMQRILSGVSTALMVFTTEIGTAHAEATKWRSRYEERTEALEKEIDRLNEIIRTEEYFLTKRKYDK